MPEPTGFTRYQRFVVASLAFLQFAVILDFMIMAPLGAMIMPTLKMSAQQFGLVVSAYAFSAGAAGLLTAGFADRFDRKRLLLFFYCGFILGTLWCGLAESFHTLLLARVVTGLFGGVIGSVVLAIAADLFPPATRGRVMGLLQTAFAASQILGLPAGLYLSNHWNWHAPFLVMVALGVLGGLVIAFGMRPVNAHLALPQERNAFTHLLNTLREPRYLLGFATISLLATGGFMLMPFSSAFVAHNLGIGLEALPTIYLVTGLFTIFVGPVVGRLADRFGKFRVFGFGCALSIVMVLVYTHLQPVPLAVVVVVNVLMFLGIFSRMIPFQAMMASVPDPAQRGAFSAISASIQQLSGGIASVIAGHIVSLSPDGHVLHLEWVGYVVVATTLGSLWLVRQVDKVAEARAAGGV